MSDSLNYSVLGLLTGGRRVPVEPAAPIAKLGHFRPVGALAQDDLTPGRRITLHHTKIRAQFEYVVLTRPYLRTSPARNDALLGIRLLHASKVEKYTHEQILAGAVDKIDTEEMYLSDIGVIADEDTGAYHPWNYTTAATEA